MTDERRAFLLELLSFLSEDITRYQDTLRFDSSLSPLQRNKLTSELSMLASDYESILDELQMLGSSDARA